MHLVVVFKVEPTRGSHLESIFEGHFTNEDVIYFYLVSRMLKKT
jgi:hypothetical protein